MMPRIASVTLALAVASCEGGGAAARVEYEDDTRRVEVSVAEIPRGGVLHRGGVLFSHASEPLRIASPGALALAAAMAETRAAASAAEWVARRRDPAGDGNKISVTLSGGVSLRQEVRDQQVEVVRAYPVLADVKNSSAESARAGP